MTDIKALLAKARAAKGLPAKPEPTPKPEPVKPALEGTRKCATYPPFEGEKPVPKPEPVKVQPEPVKVQPEPVKVQPEPVKVQPEPVKPYPKWVSDKAKEAARFKRWMEANKDKPKTCPKHGPYVDYRCKPCMVDTMRRRRAALKAR